MFSAGSSGGCPPRPPLARPRWAAAGGAGGQPAAAPGAAGAAGPAAAAGAGAAAGKEQADSQSSVFSQACTQPATTTKHVLRDPMAG